VSERVAAHALRFLRHRTKRQASLLVIRTERGQRVQVEGRAKIHMLYDCRIVGLRRRTNSNLPADLQDPQQLEKASPMKTKGSNSGAKCLLRL
jgi:hypothetical protein